MSGVVSGEATETLSLAAVEQDAQALAHAIREGRFQRSLALLTAATSVVSGLEVAYEHYRGSYSRPRALTSKYASITATVSRGAGTSITMMPRARKRATAAARSSASDIATAVR